MERSIIIPGEDGGNIHVGAMRITRTTRDEVVAELAGVASRLILNDLRPPEIEYLVLEREMIATSVVADDIAFPHATDARLANSVVVIGQAETPIAWDPVHRNVRLVVLFTGGERYHLPAMATMARILQSEETRELIRSADTTDEILETIASSARYRPQGTHAENASGDGAVSPTLFMRAAESLAGSIPGAVPAIVATTFAHGRLPGGKVAWQDWIVLDGPAASGEALHFGEITEASVVREIGRAAVDGRFADTSALVVVWGEAGSNRCTTIHVVSTGTAHQDTQAHDFHPLVVQRIERLARDLAREGREGKSVGCFFVLADPDEIESMTHQLIVNPFQGYPREARNILDPSLEETIKEFAKIDGAFVIARDGTVESAGTYIAVNPASLSHHAGEGTRHASARAITVAADALSVVVSESTRRVSVYLRGALVG